MKSVVSIFLIFSHLFSTMGFSMAIHECGGEKSYNVFGLSLNSLCECDHDSADHDDNCCKDKKVQVKADQKEKITPKAQFAKHIFEVIFLKPKFEYFIKDEPLVELKSFALGTEYPPDHSPPMYILYESFLI